MSRKGARLRAVLIVLAVLSVAIGVVDYLGHFSPEPPPLFAPRPSTSSLVSPGVPH